MNNRVKVEPHPAEFIYSKLPSSYRDKDSFRTNNIAKHYILNWQRPWWDLHITNISITATLACKSKTIFLNYRMNLADNNFARIQSSSNILSCKIWSYIKVDVALSIWHDM